MKTKFLTASLILIFSFRILPQSNFNMEAYRQFLQSHQNLTSEQLLGMYPAGTFLSNINTNFNDARLFAQIDSFYSLTDFEKQLITQHGFMVSERLKKISFGQALLEIFHQDLPVYVSVDAILHAFHISYDRILMDVELGILNEKLKQLLLNLHSKQNLLYGIYGSNPQMLTMLKDVDVYLTVPLKLLGLNTSPYYQDNLSFINQIINYINTELPSEVPLFSYSSKIIDWSQFKPRGHYTSQEYPQLAKYFKAMIWLGRIELYLIAPQALSGTGDGPTFADLQRQIIDAFLIKELFSLANAYDQYNEIENTIRIFVGDQDNVTLDNLQFLKNAIGLTSASQLLDSLKVVEFQDTLRNQSFAYQLILSQILFNNPMQPDSIVPASAFLLFGQRFVIDSYITASVVFDRIKYQGQNVCRLFPSTLDVLFALGNDASAQLLLNELQQYHYSTNLAALRYLIESYDEEFWTANFHSNWLNIIRQLNPLDDRNSLPQYMQTAAFWQKMMNSQLSSWTQLRHDHLLYAKQSFTGGTICSFPYSYVEPFPEFYQALKHFSINAKNKIQNLNFSDPYRKSVIISYLDYLSGVSDTLMTISQKELIGEMFTSQEINFLQRMIYQTGNASGPDFDGWYPNLFYRDDEFPGTQSSHRGMMDADYIVADIHTTPTDCNGVFTGWITHAGIGPVNIGVFVIPWVDGELTAFAGPMLSYYEYRTENFLRLTDEEWSAIHLNLALRPDWVNLYLADSTGNSRGPGSTLLTSVKFDDEEFDPVSYEIKVINYPNPFNSSTLIAFNVPFNLSNKNVSLKIFDINGNQISKLVDQPLASGNYIYRWEGKDIAGNSLASGVYFYNLSIADKSKTGKMILIK